MEVPAGSRPRGHGYVLETEDGTVLAAHGEAISVATNNVAEYRGLVEGLRRPPSSRWTSSRSIRLGVLVHRMRGDWKVKNDALRELWNEANDLERKLGKVTYTAVRREHKSWPTGS